ncbi:MAG: hypothetical protein K0S41_2313 [Anaerocolumna sp.]|jgi:hypothetical protein|nr:hypothetical protein [Anaerocolumna sp.]
MDNPSGLNTLPPTLGLLLNENIEAQDYFYNMDEASKIELLHYANDFQSKEELERYLYYSNNDNFK